MTTMTVKRMLELTDLELTQATHVFVESYANELKSISSDREALIRVFKSAFMKEQFYTAHVEKQVVGMMAYSTNQSRALRLDKMRLQENIGKLKGFMLYPMLAQEFHTPYSFDDHTCCIEAVATAPEWRGKGVASTLMRYFLDYLPFQVFTLEVADTNLTARRLYEKQGFTVYKSKKQRFFRKQAGLNEKLYMRYVKQ